MPTRPVSATPRGRPGPCRAAVLRTVVSAVVALVGGSGAAAHAQVLRRVDRAPVPTAVVDTALPRIMRDAKVVGLNIAVVNGDTTVYERVFGLRDREARVPADTGTVFEAASLTKPVFAYLVMGLARDGVLDLDAPLARYLAYPDIAHDPRSKQVTARMVLSHSSGLSGGRQGSRVEFVYDPGR